jgi:tetratricopeptide (TPR) repeat protein
MAQSTTAPDLSTVNGKIAFAMQLRQQGNEAVSCGEYKKAISKYTKVFAYVSGMDVPAMGKMLSNALPSSSSPNIDQKQVCSLCACACVCVYVCSVRLTLLTLSACQSLFLTLCLYSLLFNSGVNPQQEQIDSLLLAANANLGLCYLKLGDTQRTIKFTTQALTLNPKHGKSLLRRAEAYVDTEDTDKAKQDLEVAASCLPSAALQATQRKLTKKIRQQDSQQRRQFAGIFDRLSDDVEN